MYQIRENAKWNMFLLARARENAMKNKLLHHYILP